jgi:hypothetical protein
MMINSEQSAELPKSTAGMEVLVLQHLASVPAMARGMRMAARQCLIRQTLQETLGLLLCMRSPKFVHGTKIFLAISHGLAQFWAFGIRLCRARGRLGLQGASWKQCTKNAWAVDDLKQCTN